MEIEKLIDSLKKCSNHSLCEDCEFASDERNCIDSIMRNAATVLEQLQAELERVRVERDAYKVYFMDVSSKPDCNTCEKRGCEYRPRVGDIVRANCPLYSGPEKEASHD